MKGLLDTSILIGLETDRPVAELPDESAISVITLEELALGVLLAEQRGESEVATRRKATLATVEATFEALTVTQSVAMACAQIRARGRAAGVRCGPFHALIAATAVVAKLPLYTQDVSLSRLPDVDVRLV